MLVFLGVFFNEVDSLDISYRSLNMMLGERLKISLVVISGLKRLWPHLLTVRKSDFRSENQGSIPCGVIHVSSNPSDLGGMGVVSEIKDS